jgi:hypothetical protein
VVSLRFVYKNRVGELATGPCGWSKLGSEEISPYICKIASILKHSNNSSVGSVILEI